MSISVTLPSNGGGKEFVPTNQNSEYKIRLPERLKLLAEEWEVALASISLPTFDAVKRSILHKFPETTKVGFKSGLLAYEEKDQPATHPTQLKVVYGVVTLSAVLNGVVPVKDGFSFARNLVIQWHTKLNLARMTEIRRLQGTGNSVYNPRWRDPNGNKAYEQTIVFGVDEIIINGHYQHASIFTAIHEDLAVAMGIIKAKGNATPGPSTLVAFQGNDYKKPDTWARFFKLTGSEENFLEMRAYVNWEIRGLNGGWFEKEFVNPTRTLRVYSNANTSTMVGNQVSDVLRQVNFDSTKEESCNIFDSTHIFDSTKEE